MTPTCLDAKHQKPATRPQNKKTTQPTVALLVPLSCTTRAGGESFLPGAPSLQHVDQLHVKLQLRIRRDVRRRALAAVAHGRRDAQFALVADPHALYAAVPALQDSARTFQFTQVMSLGS